MVSKGTTAAVAAVAAGGSLAAGYFVFGNMAAQNVFTNMGISSDRSTLESQLTGYGYTSSMLTSLESASIWELQCLVAAHLIAQDFGLPSV